MEGEDEDMIRWFLRCPECLSVVATDVESNLPPKIHCSVCHVPVEVMGRVYRDTLVKDEELCPCDDRCTAAQGPHCDCKCGGKNHGSHALVWVTVVVGGVPTVTPIDIEKARETAKAYKEAREKAESALQAKYGAVLEEMKKGGWVKDYTLWRTVRELQVGVRKASKMKSQWARIKAFGKILEACA
jgi:hypothetical protein